MNLSFESVQKALKLGKEFLPRVGAFELAEILGITKAQMFALIEANRSVFDVDETKNINVTENKENIFATTEESFAFFLHERCGDNKELVAVVQTKKGITSNVLSPIHWSTDFEYAFYVRMDPDKNGESSKKSIAAAEGKEMGDRAVCLGRVSPGGTTPDKWIYGVLPTQEEVASRKINGKFMYFHRWVQDDANAVKWVIPADLAQTMSGMPAEAPAPVTKAEKPAKVSKKQSEPPKATTPPADVPGQQMLPGTDPKPVETAQPASIIKEQPADMKAPPAVSTTPVSERPPVAGSAQAASIKADIKAKAIEEQAAAPAATPPPLAQSIADIKPPVPQVPKSEIPLPPATPASASVGPSNAADAMGLLDGLLKAAGQT